MMLMKKIILFSLLIVSMASCSVGGLTNDYDKLSEDLKKKIVPLPDFNSVEFDKVYKINGKQLREELKNHPKSIVYIFKNGCTSKYCKPLSNYHFYAKEKGFTLFLVMNGYVNLKESLDQNVSAYLYSIDNEHYNEKYRNKYLLCFENELTNKPVNAKSGPYKGNIYFFSADKLDSISRELPKN